MNAFSMFLRLRGELPASDDLERMLGFSASFMKRRGEITGKRRIQPTDVWILDLVELDDYEEYTDEQLTNQMAKATIILEQMASSLASLDRTNCKAELYISTIRETQQGGFFLPAEIISVAAVAKLSVEVSILVMLDDYEDP